MSPTLQQDIEHLCINIIRHIQEVSGGNIQISLMILYLKLDANNKLQLMFCTDIRVLLGYFWDYNNRIKHSLILNLTYIKYNKNANCLIPPSFHSNLAIRSVTTYLWTLKNNNRVLRRNGLLALWWPLCRTNTRRSATSPWTYSTPRAACSPTREITVSIAKVRKKRQRWN